MNWKNFKTNHINLNYTIMLLPHSQKTPIHFNVPVWVFGVCSLVLLSLGGCILFFAGSSHQLHQVEAQKQQMEVEWAQEWEEISLQKQQIEEENQDLKLARDEQERELKQQEQEFKQLESKTNATLKELEKLSDRENEIRSQIGLAKVEVTEQAYAAAPGTQQTVRAQISRNSTDMVRKNLSALQNQMSAQYQTYDFLDTSIDKYMKDRHRQSVVDYALGFVGNPYVYGGNNPNTGVDCSGFTRYVMNHTSGVYLRRTAAEQSKEGRTVRSGDVRPGDLVFYGSPNSVSHVGIYIGNGKIVHASNSRTGIIVSGWRYREPVKIVNVLGD